LSSRDAAATDGSSKVAALEAELQVAIARTAELETRVAGSAEAVERAEQQAKQAVEQAQEEAKQAVERAEEEARRAVEQAAAAGSQPVLTPAAEGSDDERVAALQAEVRQLESRLEQTELRARHAYAEAENAQAELRFARDRGDAPQPAGDDGRLRKELATALERALSAEEQGAALRAELQLIKKGIDVDVDVDDSPGSDPANGYVEAVDDEGVSLRTRLTRAVDSKRASSDDDTHQWR
jgi:chromosome segregation ATPase